MGALGWDAEVTRYFEVKIFSITIAGGLYIVSMAIGYRHFGPSYDIYVLTVFGNDTWYRKWPTKTKLKSEMWRRKYFRKDVYRVFFFSFYLRKVLNRLFYEKQQKNSIQIRKDCFLIRQGYLKTLYKVRVKFVLNKVALDIPTSINFSFLMFVFSCVRIKYSRNYV